MASWWTWSEVFAFALGQLGVTPDACVFVNDMAHKVEAARALGMEAVHHTDARATEAELRRLLDF